LSTILAVPFRHGDIGMAQNCLDQTKANAGHPLNRLNNIFPAPVFTLNLNIHRSIFILLMTPLIWKKLSILFHCADYDFAGQIRGFLSASSLK
jgi:hypothetical protein